MRSDNCAFKKQCFVFAFLFCIASGMGGTAPGASVTLHAGADIQQAVNSNPPGTTFLLEAGIYRLQSVVPKEKDSFVGSTTGAAILDGAALINSFSKSGDLWTASVSVQSSVSEVGSCMPEHPLCKQPRDLYFDGEALIPVGSKSAVGEGKWYLDRNDGKIYLGSDPKGHTVEIGETEQAFVGPADGITIDLLTVEHYATHQQAAAISAQAPNDGQSSHNWVVKHCEVRWNHGTGIEGGHYSRILNNHVHHNGQLGVSGGGQNVVVQGNEIDHNNTAGYDPSWEAGGSKFNRTTNLIVDGNKVHDNAGPGLWTDGYNLNTLYQNNHTYRNMVAGIMHEISYSATIRNNSVDHDGYTASGHTSPWYGAGILVSASSNVEVYGNTVTNCLNGIILLLADRGPEFLVQNANVHDNAITQPTGIAAGAVAGPRYEGVFTSFNNHFSNNTYHLGSNSGKFFDWTNGDCTLAEWKKFGND